MSFIYLEVIYYFLCVKKLYTQSLAGDRQSMAPPTTQSIIKYSDNRDYFKGRSPLGRLLVAVFLQADCCKAPEIKNHSVF